MWFRQTHGVRLTVGRSGAVPARVARRSGRTRRIGGGDGTGAPATLPWTGRAPRWGYGPGPSRHLASTGPINLTVPARELAGEALRLRHPDHRRAHRGRGCRRHPDPGPPLRWTSEGRPAVEGLVGELLALPSAPPPASLPAAVRGAVVHCGDRGQQGVGVVYPLQLPTSFYGRSRPCWLPSGACPS